MKVTIENYRGFDIEFDTCYEKFQCVINDDNNKESKSFSAVKKFIDEYKNINKEFKPFYIIHNFKSKGYTYSKAILKVIGIRKDNRFVTEDLEGNKSQLSNYDEKYYMLHLEENNNSFKSLELINEKEGKQMLENDAERKRIIDSMKIVTLEDYAKELRK